jgi:hypothetical protein
MMRPVTLAGGVLAALLMNCAVGGCARRPPPPAPPSEPIETIVERINRHNSALPTLYATTYFEGDLVDPDTGQRTFVNTEGDLFFRPPRELLMRGRKPFGEVFEMGSTTDRYWLTVFVDRDTQWWGWHRNAAVPGARRMPIRPDMIGEVLGIGLIDPDLLKVPFPTMQFNNDLSVYMLRWNARLPNRWFVEKEIWYDARTLLPLTVLLLDTNGRVVLRAHIRAHQPVEVPSLPRDQWPRVGTRFDLYMPETGSRMVLQLRSVALRSRGGHPNDDTFIFPEQPGVSRRIQIDED